MAYIVGLIAYLLANIAIAVLIFCNMDIMATGNLQHLISMR